jgi:hypothetical protein
MLQGKLDQLLFLISLALPIAPSAGVPTFQGHGQLLTLSMLLSISALYTYRGAESIPWSGKGASTSGGPVCRVVLAQMAPGCSWLSQGTDSLPVQA